MRIVALRWNLILIFCFCASAFAADQARPAKDLEAEACTAGAGPFTVGTAGPIVLRDARRKKDLPVHVTWPEGEGPFPVIVFSHGAFGSGDRGMGGLPTFWSSHGYVCLMPTHGDSMKRLRAGGLDRRTAMRRVMPDKTTGWSPIWTERPQDVSFLLDSLDDLEARLPTLEGRLDRTRVGVGGHSLGAYTAQLVGGATVDTPEGNDRSFADDRVAAILLLSGQGSGQQGLTERSWNALARPMMTMTGSRDRGAQRQGPEWKKEPFDRSPPGDKYHVYIEGAHHGSFNGHMRREEQQTIFSYVRMATLAFWDATLDNDEGARAYLRSDRLPELSKGQVKILSK